MSEIIQNNSTDDIINFFRIFFISISTCCIASKIMNVTKFTKTKKIITFIIIIITSIIYAIEKRMISNLYITLFLLVTLSFAYSKITDSSMGNSIIAITISLSINYVLFFAAVCISFFPIFILNVENEFLILIILLITYSIEVLLFSKINRFKKGFSFLRKNNDILDMLVLNVSAIILFSIIILSNYVKGETKKIGFGIIIFAIIMFVTIQKSLQLYYKQKQLIKTLEETQAELEKYKKDVKELEEENLNISKKSHSLVHKQKQLEYKLNELLSQTETTITEKEKEELNSSIENISKELYTEKAIIELTKTDIPNIDDMLKYQQSECIKNKIDFDLQISGNIHHMINTLIPKEDLEILIADHVKDAIIAINHSNNENRSILVRLGKIDECYGIYIYDTGIEFEKETLESLGKKPSTTHADEGGTGMGFMNTFDTLRKCKASLIIKEIGKPSKDNFTKVIMIKFNNKQEFRVESYRNINIEVKLDQDSNNENNSKSKVTIK